MESNMYKSGTYNCQLKPEKNIEDAILGICVCFARLSPRTLSRALKVCLLRFRLVHTCSTYAYVEQHVRPHPRKRKKKLDKP
jgi:hypothetical protein